MARATGMGRGLGAILAVSEPSDKDRDDLRELPVDLVAPNPGQPRKHFDQEALQALADSLGERGVLQPILVRPVAGGTYELVAGERRWRAAQLAGLTTLPALVRERDDAESLEVALVENMARQDLNPIEEARAVAALVEELGLTREAVGKRIGRGRVAVTNLMRLLDLPDEAVELIEERKLTEGHGRALLLAAEHADRRALARQAADEGWSVRVTEARARELAAPAGDPRGPEAAAAPSSKRLHPDQQDAMDRVGAALGGALGTDVRVRPRGSGYKVELTFATADEALELADRLGRP